MGKFTDLTGQKFNKLTVVGRGKDYISTSGKTRKTQWLCDCDCGNKNILVVASDLKNGHTKSCGCIVKEKLIERNKSNRKYNHYILTGEYGIGVTTNTEKEFYFDLEDYNKIKNYCWNENTQGYITSSLNGIYIWLHRIIMDVYDEDIQVDHKHGRTTRNDNRKSNLRLVNNSKNQMNTQNRKDNTSSVKGVSYNKQMQKWRAYLQYDNANMHLGYFNNFEDAVTARKNAEQVYQGEYSYDNSMKDM